MSQLHSKTRSFSRAAGVGKPHFRTRVKFVSKCQRFLRWSWLQLLENHRISVTVLSPHFYLTDGKFIVTLSQYPRRDIKMKLFATSFSLSPHSEVEMPFFSACSHCLFMHTLSNYNSSREGKSLLLRIMNWVHRVGEIFVTSPIVLSAQAREYLRYSAWANSVWPKLGNGSLTCPLVS
ncbi:uncharacterized protein EI90DRAFT_2347944 [Cantharellus anzutake]|uniref:uncharacterized protein n=1 Tax=Cantharellus anzutake TaxID=1750568 RepID=UPI0019048115|nr:uncharacterized protein EI90DRAFT_2347944 [Cantharellus anzutake]KAF8324269.1 hypothetical protein EI90DRAFT_2347944 [Cantharellus anzutake]